MIAKLLTFLGLLLLPLTTEAAAKFSQAVGPPGGSFSPCEREGLVCAGDNAVCDAAGKCRCSTGNGVPHLGCFEPSYQICKIISDPKLSFFSGVAHKGVDIAMPCAFTATSVNVYNPTYGGYCSVDVSASQTRVGGNFYIGAFRAFITYSKCTSYTTCDAEFYAFGGGRNGFYEYGLSNYDSSSSKWIHSGGSERLNTLNYDLGGDNQFHLEKESNRVVLKVGNCGLLIYFRPPDSSILQVGLQEQMPGLTIGFDTDVAQVTYPTDNPNSRQLMSICLNADPKAYDIADLATKLGLRNDDALVYTAFTEGVPKPDDFPMINSTACGEIGSLLKNCNKKNQRNLAMTMCNFIYEDKPFVRCFAKRPDSSDLMELYKSCVGTYCSNPNVLQNCLDLQNTLKTSGCSSKGNELDKDINCQNWAQDVSA